MHADRSESNQRVFGSPDRETLRASHANAASYFPVLEEQLKEVGLQKCYRNAEMLSKCRYAIENAIEMQKCISLSKGEEEKGDERKGPGPGNWVLF